MLRKVGLVEAGGQGRAVVERGILTLGRGPPCGQVKKGPSWARVENHFAEVRFWPGPC